MRRPRGGAGLAPAGAASADRPAAVSDRDSERFRAKRIRSRIATGRQGSERRVICRHTPPAGGTRRSGGGRCCAVRDRGKRRPPRLARVAPLHPRAAGAAGPLRRLGRAVVDAAAAVGGGEPHPEGAEPAPADRGADGRAHAAAHGARRPDPPRAGPGRQPQAPRGADGAGARALRRAGARRARGQRASPPTGSPTTRRGASSACSATWWRG